MKYLSFDVDQPHAISQSPEHHFASLDHLGITMDICDRRIL